MVRVHEKHFPDVTVQVLITVAIHKTMILWLFVGASAGGDRLADQFIHFRPAVARQRDQHLGRFGRVADFFWRDVLNIGSVSSIA